MIYTMVGTPRDPWRGYTACQLASWEPLDWLLYGIAWVLLVSKAGANKQILDGFYLVYLMPLLLTSSECISNHMPSKVWDKITHPFPNFNGAAVEFRE